MSVVKRGMCGIKPFGMALAISSATWVGTWASAQMDAPAPEAPLGGPAVKDRDVPGVASSFGDNVEGAKRRMADRIPPRALRQAMQEALGERSPQELRLSDDQRAAIKQHFAAFESEVRTYVQAHRQELEDLRGQIPPGAMHGPAGEIYRRLDADQSERGPRRERGDKSSPEQGSGKARKSAAEIPVEVREKLRELASGMPGIDRVQTQIWAELRPEQQRAVDARLQQFRDRMTERREEMYVEKRSKAKRGPDGRKGAETDRGPRPRADRAPHGQNGADDPMMESPRDRGGRGPDDRGDRFSRGSDRHDRLMRAFDRLSPEQQERVLQRLEGQGGSENRPPRGRGRGENRPAPSEPPAPSPEDMAPKAGDQPS